MFTFTYTNYQRTTFSCGYNCIRVNMSYFESPDTGKPLAIFGTGGGRRLADELQVPLLGEVPLHPPVLEGADRGLPIVVSEPECTAARKLTAVAVEIAKQLGLTPPS